MICPACGAPVDAAARFCASCGRLLRAADDERRVVTVVFADLVGFTALSERLDPEHVKNLVDRCFDRLAAEVTAFGGQVDKVVGDAIVALFGAPVAHEDDAERAVRASLRMHELIGEERTETGHALQLRVGVNTGEVLVGAMRAAGSATAMGDVVNTASRLQTTAAPGEVLVGPATYTATRHAIAYDSRGTIEARGREEPVETWRALAPTSAPGYRARRIDVPLVGRRHEIGLLSHAVQMSIEHQRALLVLVVADEGMGKTRLAAEVSRWSAGEYEAITRQGRCLPYGEVNVWWPVADALRTGIGIGERDSRESCLATLQNHLRTLFGATRGPNGVRSADVDWMAEAMLPLLGFDAPAELDPIVVRSEAGRALGVYLTALSSNRPFVLQVSDLHWADEAVLDLCDDVLAVVSHQPVVMVATARPSLFDRWSPRSGRHNVLTVHLDPLSQDESAELLDALVGRPLPERVASELIHRSGGNPFFLEELVSLVDIDALAAETPGRPGHHLPEALPDTLRGLLAARLDDLEPELRSVLQYASVMGEQGPITALAEMTGKLLAEVDLGEALDALVSEEIMNVHDGLWTFRSHLMREVAYQTITKSDRAKTHLGIARFIDEKSQALESRPAWVVDQLANHYAAAAELARDLGIVGAPDGPPPDLPSRARRWVAESAEGAARDRALPTALLRYDRAIALAEAEDHVDPAELADLHLARAAIAVEAWDKDRAESDVAAARSAVDLARHPTVHARVVIIEGRIAQKVGDAPGAVQSLTQAENLYAGIGDQRGRAEALRQRAMVEIFDGRLPEAAGSARDALKAFELVGDRAGQGWAQQNLAWTSFMEGRLTEADDRLHAALDLFGSVGDTRGRAWCNGLLAWVRYQQGRLTDARELGQRVLGEAEDREDPWATAMMRMLMGSICLWAGETEVAVRAASEALDSFVALGDSYGLGQAQALLGRALVMTGQVDEGFSVLDAHASASGADRGDRQVSESPGLGAARQMLARMAILGAALQIGETGRADEAIAWLDPEQGGWGDDPHVGRALYLLQAGRWDEAEQAMAPARGSSDPARLAVEALLSAVRGHGRAAELVEQIEPLGSTTYLDRTMAHLAAGLEAAATGHAENALAHRSRALESVAATEDRVAHAVAALFSAAIARMVDAPDAADEQARADAEFAELGVEPEGWRTIVATVERPPEAPAAR